MCLYRLPHSPKAYKLLNLETNKIFVSRDVIFHEKHLPYHLSETPQDQCHSLFLPTYTLSNHTPINVPDVFLCDDASSATSHTHFTSPSQNITPQTTPIHTTNTTSDPLPSFSLPPTSSPSLPTRHSTRNHTLPAWMQDFACIVSKIPTHWCNLISYNALPACSKAFISTLSKLTEPTLTLKHHNTQNGLML